MDTAGKEAINKVNHHVSPKKKKRLTSRRSYFEGKLCVKLDHFTIQYRAVTALVNVSRPHKLIHTKSGWVSKVLAPTVQNYRLQTLHAPRVRLLYKPPPAARLLLPYYYHTATNEPPLAGVQQL